MLAMFTEASPSEVPINPTTPGRSSFSTKRKRPFGERHGGFGDLQAESLGHGRRVDQIDLRLVVCGREVAGEGLAGDQLGVEFRHRAEVGNPDRIALRGRDFRQQRPERVGEIHVGAHALECAAVEVGHVHRIADFAGDEEVPHLLGDLDADIFLCLRGGSAEVRGEDAFPCAEQREIRGGRLGLEHI
jgi:hypothetical protein